MPDWTVRATWMEDDAEVSEEWLIAADTAHQAVERATTHTRFPPHHVEARRLDPGEAKGATDRPRRVVARG